MKKLVSAVLLICLQMTVVPVSAIAAEESDLSELITYEQPKNWDDYYIDSDPMQISDEEFFGVWDKESEKWVSAPYFRYDDYPDMESVKEEVQDGDYDAAKDELLKYYRHVAPGRSTAQTTHPGKVKRMSSLALEKNAYYVNAMNGSIINFFSVNNDLAEHRIDVLDAFKQSTVIGIEQIRGFVINSVDKFNTEAEIYSRESEYAPRLELIVNGMSVVYTASKDAMVRGGIYSENNYGSDKIMTVRESGTYMNFNENTKRAYIAFDISNLKTTDIVSGATLILTGRNASGTGEKELGVYCLFDMSFDEEKIKFSDYSDCMLWSENDHNTWDYVTSNYSAVKGKACFYHRGDELHYVAQMYSYTNEERYAYTFIRQHMGLVHNVGFNNGVFNALDISRHLANASNDLYWVIASDYMTGETLTAMLKTWWLMCDYHVNTYYGTGTNNWASYATQGVYAILARFPELAVFDEWYNATLEENERICGLFIQEDGLPVELGQGYLNTIISTFEEPCRIQQYTGVEAPYTDAVYDTVHKLLEGYILCSGPGFRGTNIGDSNDYTSTAHARIKYWYNNVFRDDKMFEYVVTNGVSGLMPENPTSNYPVTARTFMRESWDSDARWMAFIATGSGSHGHKDMLSVSMFYKSKYLLVDPAYGSTLTDDSYEYMSSAPQHNLVTINGQNYSGTMNAITEKFESNKFYDFVEYSGSYYTGYNQRRSVLFLKNQGFWIITDYLNPLDQKTIQSYEQNWHMLPSAGLSIDEDDLEVRSNFDDINVIVAPVGIDGMTGYTEDTLFAPIAGSFSDSKKGVLQKVQSGDVIFNTIIMPRDINEDYKIDSEIIDMGMGDSANAFSAKITNTATNDVSYYYYYHLNKPELQQAVNLAHFKTDAATALIETDKDGNVLSAFLADASLLENTTLKEPVLFKSNNTVDAISYEKKGEIFSIYSTALDAGMMRDITVCAPGASRVKLNGEVIDGKKSGKYFYFGDEPIVEGITEDEGVKDGEENQKPVHGGGTSSGGGAGAAPGISVPPTDTNTEIQDKPAEDKIPSNIYRELENHWGSEEIKSLYEKGIITGDSEGLRLKDNISRAEFTALIVRALGLDTVEYNGEFDDVTQDIWCADIIATAKANGIAEGSDGMFRPMDAITREEICKIVISAMKVDNNEIKQADFADMDSVSEWAADSVNIAYNYGIVNGMGDGTFAPKSYALREQAFVMIWRMMEKMSN